MKLFFDCDTSTANESPPRCQAKSPVDMHAKASNGGRRIFLDPNPRIFHVPSKKKERIRLWKREANGEETSQRHPYATKMGNSFGVSEQDDEEDGEACCEGIEQSKRGQKLFEKYLAAQEKSQKEFEENKKEQKQTILEAEAILRAQAPNWFGQFKLIRPIARGTSGIVLKASYTPRSVSSVSISVSQKELTVALKICRIGDKLDRHMFKQEAKIQRLVEHENVVKLIDFILTEEFAIFCLEYVDTSLLNYVVQMNAEDRHPEDMVSKLMVDVTRALSHVHSCGFGHFDVKLDNILFSTKEDRAKLCDFGLAGIKNQDRQYYTPLYEPPEVGLYGKVSEKSDLWSLGVVLFILLVGYPPFQATEDLTLREVISKDRYFFEPSLWKGVSLEARDLIGNLLVLDEKERPSAQMILRHPFLQTKSLLTSIGERESSQDHHEREEQHKKKALRQRTLSVLARSKNAVRWIPDKEAKCCRLCGISFSLFTRRHHCRKCGQVICNACSQERDFVPTHAKKEITKEEEIVDDQLVRVCKICHESLVTRNFSCPFEAPSPGAISLRRSVSETTRTHFSINISGTEEIQDLFDFGSVASLSNGQGI